MYLKELEIEGFKSFSKNTTLFFPVNITGIVGPNGSGKSNITEAFRFVLGEQSIKTLRGKRGEDLIFNGGTGETKSNKAYVKLTFNNKDHKLNDVFDEVSVSRTVFRDGSNEYQINNTQVRHRDVIELLSKANIGSTGHHIISQGEADKVLNSNTETRKEILEDGLGLKLLQFRKIEIEKKLKKSEINIKEANLIVKEIITHFKYLKREVDRFEKSKTFKEELKKLYAEYIAKEIKYINDTKKSNEKLYTTLKEKFNELENKIKNEKDNLENTDLAKNYIEKSKEIQNKIIFIREKKDGLSIKLGRIEGEKSIIKNINVDSDTTIKREEIESLLNTIKKRYEDKIDSSTIVKYCIDRLKNLIFRTNGPNVNTYNKLNELDEKELKLKKEIADLKNKEQELINTQNSDRFEQHEKIQNMQKKEQVVLKLLTEKNEIDRKISEVKYEMKIIEVDEEILKQELDEGAVLIGKDIDMYKEQNILHIEVRDIQKKRKKDLERKKIELETTGTNTGEEVYKEYTEVKERIDFLTKEKEDLLKSIKDGKEAVEKIKKETDKKFNVGIKLISKEFEHFFRILFGGGHASLVIERKTIEKEDELPEEKIGVDIKLSLPYKKITSLDILSGGERTLVSVALLFAISQITPPPFLILDETDAALDETNSRRYGNMIEALSKKSQLILITHNRETMLRAGAMYGITMNRHGVSKILSIQFEEAVTVAK